MKHKSLYLIAFLLIASILFVYNAKNYLPKSLTFDVKKEFEPFCFPQLENIVKKPLKYLGQGMQSIAFISSDGEYVVKFFLKKKPKANWLAKMLYLKPGSIRYDILARYNKAYKDLKQESALVAVHLCSSTQPIPSCTLLDKYDNEYQVDLCRASFIIQKRGIPLNKIYPSLNEEERLNIANKIKALLKNIASKGYKNMSSHFNTENYALVNDEPIIIDLGNVVFCKEIKQNPSKEIDKMLCYFEQWNTK